MIKDVYIVCGVPGAGKTWACKQAASAYTYVPHDEHADGTVGQVALVQALKKAAQTGSKPLLTECPFGERVLRDVLINHGFTVHPVFIVEHVDVVRARYTPRGRELPKNSATRAGRAGRIASRAKDWKCPSGTSSEIAELLKLAAYQSSLNNAI